MSLLSYDLIKLQEYLKSKEISPLKIQNIKTIYKATCKGYPVAQMEEFRTRLVHSYGKEGEHLYTELQKVL